MVRTKMTALKAQTMKLMGKLSEDKELCEKIVEKLHSENENFRHYNVLEVSDESGNILGYAVHSRHCGYLMIGAFNESN